MGLCIDISKRVSVELRRESFRLYVGTDADQVESVEFDYKDFADIQAALFKVEKSDRYLDDFPRRQVAALKGEQ